MAPGRSHAALAEFHVDESNIGAQLDSASMGDLPSIGKNAMHRTAPKHMWR